MKESRFKLQMAARYALHGKPKMPESVTRTEVFKAESQQCIACNRWTTEGYDADAELCSECKADLGGK